MGQAATNRPPNVPNNLRIAAPRDVHCGPDHRPTLVRDTPAIQATLTDPDGRARRLSLRVEVYSGLTGSRIWVGLSPRVLNPSTVRMSLSSRKVTHPGVYRWRVRADDTIIAGKWSTFCYFKIDRQTSGWIDSVDYPRYRGAEQGWNPEEGRDRAYGKPGQAGRFRLVEDDRRGAFFKYRLNNDPWRTATPTESDRSAVVSVTPWRFGLNTFSAYVIDEAGNTSQVNKWTFRVGGAPQPVAAWRFDERSGATAVDYVGDHDARVTNATPTWENTGRLNGTLRLGSGGTAATTGAVVDTSKSFSVSAWVRLDGTQDARVVSQPGFALLRSGGAWSFQRQSTATFVTKVAKGQWTHLLGVYDSVAHEQRLYVNGRLEAEVSAFGGSSAAGPLTFGALTGAIDHVKLWNRALPSDEIRPVFDVEDGAQKPQPELVAHWKFDEGAGPAAADSSGHGHAVDVGAGVDWVDAGGGYGTALRLNARSEGTARTKGPVVDGTGSFTITARVRPLRASAVGPVIAQGGAVPAGFSDRPNVELAITKPEWWWTYAWAMSRSSNFLVDRKEKGSDGIWGQWRYAALVYDSARGLQRSYYLTDRSFTDLVPKVWHSDEPLTFGEVLPNSESTTAFVGDVDDVRVYAGIMTEEQVRAIIDAD
ncbi:LamG domain-containing protein [Tenggerimyces flavus]|uniref:LamG-like jellyroll fold domain-containing protein n=1 Tax=Tenggerimyces flavus TaxID=1708749 RepID=A0ABV7YJV1_9ACTN|nr:LamG domain-containing protein [Tenggerimyces flavus]MBM7784100.1 hypothetical protein [Tenggerimyces flavus]